MKEISKLTYLIKTNPSTYVEGVNVSLARQPASAYLI